ncbi:MAG: DUF1444 family protein [Bacteroidetes bacterium]|nr:DUF1444 family protein [Bacteroidota bacterium]
MRKLMYIAAIAALASCHSSTSPSSTRISKREFCQLYRDSMAHRFPSVSFQVVDERTIRSVAGSKGANYYIDNAYETYMSGSADSLGAVLHRYANSAADVYDLDVASQDENVVPVVRSAKSMEAIKATMLQQVAKKPGSAILYEPYNDELVVCYAIDTKNNIRYMQENDLRTMHLTMDSLRAKSVRNLARKLQVRREGDNGIYMWVAGGNYEASLILLKDLWTKEQLPVDGDFIIAIPSRDVVLITGSKNKVGLQKLTEFSKKTYDGGAYSVSPALFHWDGKKFTPIGQKG